MSDSATSRTIACQTSLSTGFSRQEYWSGLPLHPAGDLPHSGIKPMFLASPALASEFLTAVPPGKSCNILSNLRDFLVALDTLLPPYENFFGTPFQSPNKIPSL